MLRINDLVKEAGSKDITPATIVEIYQHEHNGKIFYKVKFKEGEKEKISSYLPEHRLEKLNNDTPTIPTTTFINLNLNKS